jgi:streptogramin lyase
MVKRTAAIFLLLVTGIVLFISIFSASATPAAPDESTLVEYSLPAGISGPQNIAVQEPGHVWFTLPQENAIGELVVTTTVDYAFTIHPVPTSNSEPYDLVYDGRYIWFTERAGSQLGQLDTITNIITETTVTPAGSMPTSIDVSPAGNVWFTKPGTATENISKFDPATATFQSYTYANANPAAVPQDITVVNDNLIAFTVPAIDTMVELDLDPVTDFKEIILNTVGNPSFPPGGITNDGQGVWVSAPTRNWLGLHVPGTYSNFLWVSLLSDTAAPTAIFYHPDGLLRQIWYVGATSSHIGNIVVDSDGKKVSMLDFILPQANSQPADIAVDSGDHAWITESGTDKIAEWRPPYVIPVYLPIITK